MNTLVAHHHPYPMTLPYTQSPASSANSSPYIHPQELAFHPIDQHSRHSLPPQYFDRPSHPSTSLSISTVNSGPHPQEPEEETAHPSRIPQRVPLDIQRDQPEASSSATSSANPSQRSSPAINGATLSSAEAIEASFTGLSRPLTHQERELLAHLDRLKFFLATAPSRWSADHPASAEGALPLGHPNSAHPALNRFLLPNSEYVSCVLWGGLYHITGTDIVRALVFRFEAFGRPVKNMKKFEEGVFSDLRNLKPGVDACLEEPKSPFLDLLFKYQCIRTQKKQKVFYWFSVPHDRLFLDALERDLKREKMGMEPTTVVTGEPALSFTYDPKRSLFEQFSKAQGAVEGEGELETAVRIADEAMNASDDESKAPGSSSASDADASSSEVDDMSNAEDSGCGSKNVKKRVPAALQGPNSPFFSMFSIFEGSPTYKQRRKKIPKGNRRSPSAMSFPAFRDSPDDYLNGSMYSTRMSEPQVDRFGRDTSRLSAEDMFVLQTRGEFGPQSNPDLVATQKERQRRAMQAAAYDSTGRPFVSSLSGPGVAGRSGSYAQQQQQQPSSLHPSVMMGGGPETSMDINGYIQRPHVEQRHTFPLVNVPQQHRTNTQPFDSQSSGMAAAWPLSSEPISIPRTKAFVCPLYSCGRMFKRMEHLKRHLRTHTLERPYQCTRCKKRFSRSDNLNQHYRTHLRGDGAEMVDDEGGNADVESEEVDELEGDDGSFDGGYLEGIGNISNVQMYEVEIQGQVQEVQGDEEGLVCTVSQPMASATIVSGDEADDGQDVYLTDSNVVTASDQSSFVATSTESPGVQWATLRAQPSPAFSASSMPSPQPRMTATPSSSYNHLGEYVSMSAPSHKAAFDHATLYPPEIVNNLAAANGTGAGPIRRHRSATPSVGRFGEGIRRPYSAAISDHGSANPRSYHPYAVAAAHSAESSPMSYSVPLDGYDQQSHMPMAVSRSGSHSRSSSAGGGTLQEQMHQMLNLEQIDPESMVAAAGYTHEPAASVQGYGQMYHQAQPRTESPMPLQFTTGAPSNGAGAYGVGLVGMTGMVDPSHQFATAQSVEAGFYGHQVAM